VTETVAVEAIKIVPAILWVVFAALVFLTLRRAILPQFGRLSTVKTPVFEASFTEKAEKLLGQAAAIVENGPPPEGERQTAPTASERRGTVSRLEHAIDYLKGGRILWVDDHPEWNGSLVSLFREVGMIVDTSQSTDQALSRLRSHSYDIVITDMRRDTEEPADVAGMTLLSALDRHLAPLPVIVFAAAFDPMRGVHPGIFAYTNRTDDVVQYVIDLMERIKFGAIV
jgi:CheY-like chemotaxis protein